MVNYGYKKLLNQPHFDNLYVSLVGGHLNVMTLLKLLTYHDISLISGHLSDYPSLADKTFAPNRFI